MLDDLDERMQPENIEFEIQNLMDITKDWFANCYLDVAETGWLIGKLNDASGYMNS
jgi:hypothetical protein